MTLLRMIGYYVLWLSSLLADRFDGTHAPASGKPLYIVGVTHWQIVHGRIAVETTVFDELSVIAQTLD